jgi:tetratricopeptide (TPR) repeat protein
MPQTVDLRRPAGRVIKRAMTSLTGASWLLPGSATSRAEIAALAATLVGACVLVGLPLVTAPWLPGDEYIFIADNPDVTDAASGSRSLAQLVGAIFRFPPEEDLYQPLPIFTYAIQWAIWGDRPAAVRFADVLIHAANAVLLWMVVTRILRHFLPSASPVLLARFSWLAALLWAVHPVNAHAWAADMGRTHVLSATFALLALGAQLQALLTGRPAWLWVAGSALLCAMLCKVLPAWFALATGLQISISTASRTLSASPGRGSAWRGWRATIRSPWPYASFAICAAFSAAAWWTSRTSGLMEDASAGLFGDPIARSALATYLYARNLLVPLWLSPWYLPDPQTNWANPRVLVGLAIAIATAVCAFWTWKASARRPIAIGWLWFWSLLLPVIGLVGAREAAAVDRYLYQPTMGLALAVACAFSARFVEQKRASAWRLRAVLAGTALAVICLMLVTCGIVRTYRAPVARASRIAQMYPTDPRALEALAAAFHFAATHPLPTEDLALAPAGQPVRPFFLRERLETLRAAAATPNLARYFPGAADLAPFHRRLSAAFADLGEFGDALVHAQAAAELEPDEFRTWVRLAHAYAGLRRYEDAVRAFERCETLLPEDPLTRATHYTNFGRLLLFELDRADLAYPKFRKAVELKAQLPAKYRRALRIADIGLARCEIRVGQGARGYQLIMAVLDDNPQDALAGLVLAEYHLRSHHWEEAWQIYAMLIEAYPAVYSRLDWYYEALRGFDAACAQLGRWSDAVLAWNHAVEQQAGAFAADLLAQEPDNPLGCLAQMLLSLRAGRVDEAVQWVRQAARGEPVPKARALERAVAMLRLLSADGRLPNTAGIVEAAVYLAAGEVERAARTLSEYRSTHPDAAWDYLIGELASTARLPASEPATGPAVETEQGGGE